APILLLCSACRESAAGNVELVPANNSRPGRKIQDVSLISPQRFRAVAELIYHRRHDFIAKSIQLKRRSRLRHDCKAGGICPRFDEWIDCDLGIRTVIGANAESRICRCDKIDMKQPAMDLSQSRVFTGRAVHSEKHFISARRRRVASAK